MVDGNGTLQPPANRATTLNWIDMSPFRFWCQKVLPLVFDDSISYYEVLCKLSNSINEVINNVEYLRQFVDDSGLQELLDRVEGLQEVLEEIEHKFETGGYIDAIIDQLNNYVDQNIEGIVGRTMKFINFGLSDDGYFVAYIPHTWDFISFDTIVDPTNPLYGHLLVRW